VRFEADLDLAQPSYRCNCSICRRTRFWPAVACCLANVSEEELARTPITYVDGASDRFAGPAHRSHL
jgi:hypothetical protein